MKKNAVYKIAVFAVLAALAIAVPNIRLLKEQAKCIRDSINPYFPVGPLTVARNVSEIPFESKNGAVLFIHDVSPEYLRYLYGITDAVNKHNFQKYTYLFLITYHHGKYNMENYPKYVSFLKKLQKEGYHIEFHAYLHNGAEFDCNYKTAVKKWEISEGIMRRCGFNSINLFFPPHGKVSKGALRAFLERGVSVITRRTLFVLEHSETKAFAIDNQEFTWYINSKELKYKLSRAKSNYKMALKENELFCLSVHPKAINDPAGMEFLNEMLGYIVLGK